MSGPPGGYGPRPNGLDDERTPVAPHPKPAPVVVRSGTQPRQPPPLPPRATPRAPTPLGGTLAPLGPAPVPAPPKLVTEQERVRMAIMSRVLRTCDALSLDDLRLVSAFALRLRPGFEPKQ